MKKLFSLFFLLFFAVSAFGTHNRAGEILYKRISPFTKVVNGVTVDVYTYSITVVKYTDDGAAVADRCVDTVYFGDGDRAVAPRVNGSSACGCGVLNGTAITCGSLIVNDPGYRVKYNVYSVTHTYPGPGQYLIRSFDPNRNQGVHNIPNSVNLPFYIESQLIISSFTGANSSPVLMNPPVDQATVGVCFYHNPGAVDPDGDSLSYEVSTCRGENGQTVSGYMYPELGFNGSFTINPVSGLLSWCVPQFLDEYNIAILIKEWRKNTSGIPQVIGYVLRDMQVIVKYGVVGLKENNAGENVQISPNPVSAACEINLGAEIGKQVETLIYSSEGKLVFNSTEMPVSQKLVINLNGLVRGIYMMHLKVGSRTVLKKIVKD